MTTIISSSDPREITPNEQYERQCLPIAKEVEAATRIAFNVATIIAQYGVASEFVKNRTLSTETIRVQ
jgi:hypothetical protein